MKFNLKSKIKFILEILIMGKDRKVDAALKQTRVLKEEVKTRLGEAS